MNPIEKIARFTSNHPKKAITLTLILTLIFLILSSTLEMETSLESLFPNYPEVKIMEGIQKDFGNEEPVIILLQGNDVLMPESFKQVAEIEEKFWKDELVYNTLINPKDQSIISLPSLLANYRLAMKGNFNPTWRQIIEEVRSFSSEKEIRATLKAFLDDSNVPQIMKDYALAFLPKGFNEKDMEADKMVIYVSLNGSLSDEELQKVELRIEDTAHSVKGPNKALVYGFKLIDYYYMKTEERLAPAFLMALVLILAVMIINFRRVSDILIAFITLFLGIIWTMGFAGLMGWKIDFMAGMVPILILGLGIDFSFHVLMGYRERLIQVKDPKKATYLVLATSGIAFLLAAITTVVGFSSNGISDVPSMRHFGFLAAFGIFSIFLLNMTFVPALRELDLRKSEKIPKVSDGKKVRRNGIVKKLIWLVKHPKVSVLLLLFIFAIAIPGFMAGSEMKASYDPTGELASDFEITQAYNTLNEEFEVGTETVFIRVDGDLTDPELWRNIAGAVENMSNDIYVVRQGSKARAEWLLGVIPMLLMENPKLAQAYLLVDKDMNGQIDEDVTPEKLRAFLNAIYEERITRYFIHRDANGNFDSLLIRVATRTKFGYHGRVLLEELREDFKGVDAEISITGTPVVWAKGLDDIRDSMVYSILLCLAFAFLVLPVAFYFAHRSVLLGILTAIPPLVTIGWLFITMKLLNLPLNLMTATVGAIIVGIGIDYPIHIANRWALERKKGKSLEECYAISLASTGREVFFSAITTLIAFGIFITIPIPVITQFATTILFGLIYSFIGAVITLPLLLRILWHRGD